MKKGLSVLTKNKNKFLLCIFGAVAGLVNGLIGSGGGLFLWFGFRYFDDCKEKNIYAATTTGVLAFSIISGIIYLFEESLAFKDFSYALIPALLGGTLGAFLLGKINTRLLQTIFSILLLISGVILVI